MAKKYNKKLLHSKSYVEVYEYEFPIFTKSEKYVSHEEHQDSKVESKKRREFDELNDEEQMKRLTLMKKRRLESKHKLVRLIDINANSTKTSFLTLTTKENIDDRNSFTKIFMLFIKKINYNIFDSKKAVLQYVGVLERQKRGAWHIHVLLFNVPFIPHKQLLEMWGHGAVRINKLNHLDSASNIGRYVSKYMEKGIDQNLLESFGKKSYLASRNLRRIDETKFYSKTELELDDSVVLYETEYISKAYRNGKLVDNKVRYRKIKLDIEEKNNE